MQTVNFIDELAIRAAAENAFEHYRSLIAGRLPRASVEHIGSTAIAGSLTKGDLDLLVYVAPADFPAAEAVLAEHFQRNSESLHNDVFASFKDDGADLPLGIQLTCDEALRDEFVRFREALLRDPLLVAAYNDLKRASEGLPMDEYRQRKDDFIRRVLEGSAD